MLACLNIQLALMVPFLWLLAVCRIVELTWTLAALCSVKTDELDDLVVYLAWGGTPGCGLFGLT